MTGLIVRKKILSVGLALLMVSPAYSSQLSRYVHRIDAEQRERQAQEWAQDMNFNDLVFRLERRFEENSRVCRSYEFRSRSNPYRAGHYVVCDVQNHEHGRFYNNNRHGH